MTAVTLRPNATNASGTLTATPSGTLHGVTSDNSDSTYALGDGYVYLGLGTVSMPAGSVVKSIQPRVRFARPLGVYYFYYQVRTGDGFGSILTNNSQVDTATPTTYTGTLLSSPISQADLDALQILVSCAGINDGRIYEVYLDVVYCPPPTVSVSAPTGTITATLAPNVSWTHTAGSDASGQGGYRVKIFNATQYGAGGFDPDTSPSVADSGFVSGSASSWNPGTLANATSYRAYVKTYQYTNSVEQSSAWAFSSFTVNVPPGVPTLVTPANGGTVSSSRPALNGTVYTSGLTARREWQFATNAGFTTGVITITEPVGSLRDNPTGSYAFPVASGRLAQGTWYLRSRSIDSTGAYSGYSSTNVFTVAHAPSTTSRTPTGAQSVLYATTRRVDWLFTDPDAADFQLKYQAQLWKLSAPGSPIDTGQVTASSQFHNFTGLDSTWRDTELRWRVQVWDQDNVASGWSTEQAFFMRDPATISVTSPTNLEVINNAAPLITWSFSASAGRTQAQWRITIRNMTTGIDVITSGWVTSTATSWQVPSPVILVGPTFRITLEVIDSVGLTNSTTRNFTASYAVPAGPTYSITSINYPSTGQVFIEWSGATADVDFVEWRVYRREDSGPWTLIYSTDVATVRLYDDYAAPSGVFVEYAVVQAILDTGNVIETAYNPTAMTEELENYMLTCPGNPALNLVLYHVSGENFADEQEMAAVNLLGRGRRIEYGTRYGILGTLEVSFRDQATETAREQRVKLEALRDSGLDVYLLNPFGDVYRVAMMSASVTRVPGTGRHEMAGASIAYSEVTA